jgi:tetratricopeptide (TPR) repeat protein
MAKKTRWFLLGCFLFWPFLAYAANSRAQDYEDQAMALFNRGLFEKSIQYFNLAVQADPEDWQAWEKMGDAYAKLDKTQEALTYYSKSLQINPGNPALRSTVDSLKETTVPPASQPKPPDNPAPKTDNASSWDENPPPAGKGKDVSQPAPAKRAPRTYTSADLPGSSPMNNARIWTKFEVGYNYSVLADLVNGAKGVNQDVVANPPATGSGSMGNDGLGLGAEVGFLINPNNGLAIGLRYIQAGDYLLNENLNNGGSYTDGAVTYTFPSDYEDLRLHPYATSLTLDYYLFLPDSTGRFFLSAGAGYYFGVVQVEQSLSNYVTTFMKYGVDTGIEDTVSGDLTSGAFGFQLGIGREFLVSRNVGITLYARGRYAKITNFRGELTDSYGYVGTFGLAKDDVNFGIVDVNNTGNIGGNGESYATMDFTGFDAGVAVNFYTF